MRYSLLRNAAKAVKRLKEMGIKTPIVSMGSQGVVYDYQGQIIHEPGIEIQAVDTTAAGDTFIGIWLPGCLWEKNFQKQ